ncbi:hypothetical protein [Rhodococcus pyridinivorans]|uniref:Uncharacterized protein n=1 Tax=Rhodococcus pyridinivorans TaxID=103816 RepID=A0A7M2XNR8_9NOCA|nr:hypothetical protein [Rhodococcus pyridinivorans]QOV99526.1 hypothetical protein INP59_03750 [Rhodococcus pyridinivorans]
MSEADTGGEITVNLTMKTGEQISVTVAGHSSIEQAIGVLAQVGKPEFLLNLYSEATGVGGLSELGEDEE